MKAQPAKTTQNKHRGRLVRVATQDLCLHIADVLPLILCAW